MSMGIMLARFLIFTLLLQLWATAEISIIPQPRKLEVLEGVYDVPQTVSISAVGEGISRHADRLTKWLESEWSIKGKRVAEGGDIRLEVKHDLECGEEGYRLGISETGVLIQGKSAAGVFYGLQSLKQLGAKTADGPQLELPRVSIEDEPRYAWRGMHLDVSRHFYDKEYIKTYIDYLASYKMNRFHWHLVDGPGWRIEIKKYPKLTEVGAWRKDKTSREWSWRDTEINPDGKQAGDYGGYYTQDDVREIVAYAAARHVTVVPEIEMPGHSYAVLVAYPEFACPTNKIMTEGLRGKDVFCVGNPGTSVFLQNILDEVLELFPSKHIHIGADEVSKMAWRECPRCQAVMKKEGLHDEEELQSHFVRSMEKYLKSKGRILIGWDEINEGGLPEDATVMVWRDEKFARAALEQEHPVIMCPASHCYFDYYQTKDKDEPKAIGGHLPTKVVYSYDPELEGLTEEQKKLILGAQGNVWTEYIQNPAHLEYMLFPRMCALAEVVWTPKERKDWESFKQRVETHKKSWSKRGIHFFKKSL